MVNAITQALMAGTAEPVASSEVAVTVLFLCVISSLTITKMASA